MRHPKELGERELAEIAFTVRQRLESEFTPDTIANFIQTDPKFAHAIFRHTYLAVREKLERRNMS